VALQGEQAFGEAGVLGGVGDAQGVEGAGLGLATGDGLGGVPELCGEGLDGRGGVVGGGRKAWGSAMRAPRRENQVSRWGLTVWGEPRPMCWRTRSMVGRWPSRRSASAARQTSWSVMPLAMEGAPQAR
jgi:hypothetical protein